MVVVALKYGTQSVWSNESGPSMGKNWLAGAVLEKASILRNQKNHAHVVKALWCIESIHSLCINWLQNGAPSLLSSRLFYLEKRRMIDGGRLLAGKWMTCLSAVKHWTRNAKSIFYASRFLLPYTRRSTSDQLLPRTLYLNHFQSNATAHWPRMVRNTNPTSNYSILSGRITSAVHNT